MQEKAKKKQVMIITGCILSNDYILMTQRNEPELPEADKKWDFPGGKMEFGEDANETIQREIKEELGIEVEPEEMIPYIQTNVWNYEDHCLHAIVCCYVCKLTSQSQKKNIKLEERKVKKAKWLKIEEINIKNVLPGIDRFLTWIVKEKFNIELSDKINDFFINLVCEIPDKNINKYYYLSNQPKQVPSSHKQLLLFGKEKPFASRQITGLNLLIKSSGRIGAKPKIFTEEYYSVNMIKKRMRQILNKKLKKGYKLYGSNLGNTIEEINENLLKEDEDYS